MKIKIGILFGGISNERNVSLNSARSVFDHLSDADNTEISLIFVNKKEAFYKIESRYIYSSSSSDFDFKIDKIATKIALSKSKMNVTLCYQYYMEHLVKMAQFKKF